jgi:hypothetical protein
MSDDCDNDNIDKYKKSIKDIVLLFQQDIAGVASGIKSASDLKNLFLASSYVDGLKEIAKSADNDMIKVKNCIENYRIQAENNGNKIESKDTSIVMYSDTTKLNKINLFKNIILIIGIILTCFFLYFLNKKLI